MGGKGKAKPEPAPEPDALEDDDDEVTGPDASPDAPKKKKRPKKKKGKGKDGEDADCLAPIPEGGAVHTAELYSPAPENSIPEEWVDITAECELAMKSMFIGEMIESPTFRLFDAMSAIEIMDPKMDSGFKNTEDVTLEKAVETGIMQTTLSHESLLAIWDHLLMYLLLWLDGHTIVQTIFSCLYLQDLEAYVKPIPLFGAFMDAFLMISRKSRGIILRAGAFDDEDFLPALFGLDLEMCVYSSVPKDVKDRIDKECKALRGSKSQVAKALLWRLEFVNELMLALIEFSNEPKKGKNPMETAQKRLTSCLGHLEKLAQTCDLANSDVLKCFDASINRKLVVPGPPRTVSPIENPRVAFSMWETRIQELLLCCSLPDKSLTPVLEGCISYKEEPNVLARSVALNWVLDTPGLIQKLMLDSLDNFLFPCDALQHCKKTTEAFLTNCENLFAHIFKLTHHNRARRFRRLAHIFSDLNNMQHKAWQLDEELKETFGANLRYPRPCWVWIMEQCLQMMLAKLLLGFELDLYDEAEFHMIYWYSDYLLGLRVYNFNELYHALEQPAGGDKKKGRQAAARQAAGQGPSKRPRNPPPFLLLLEATQNAVRGLFRLLAFCIREDLLKTSSAVTDGLAQRFVLRFRSLELFRLPHLPSFRDFQVSSASAMPPVDSRIVLEAAQSSLNEAGQLLDKMAAITKGQEDTDYCAVRDQAAAKSLKKVVVANQLAIAQLLRPSDKPRSVVASLSHHPHFVSLQVQVDKS